MFCLGSVLGKNMLENGRGFASAGGGANFQTWTWKEAWNQEMIQIWNYEYKRSKKKNNKQKKPTFDADSAFSSVYF